MAVIFINGLSQVHKATIVFQGSGDHQTGGEKIGVKSLQGLPLTSGISTRKHGFIMGLEITPVSKEKLVLDSDLSVTIVIRTSTHWLEKRFIIRP
jgi:hypothetical protein